METTMKKIIPAIALFLCACAGTTQQAGDAKKPITEPSSPESRVTEGGGQRTPNAGPPPSPNISSDVTYSRQR
jgi:hypothetical protein